MFVLTKKGRSEAKRYIKEMKAKRKEILDAGLDTADDTNLPTVEDIQADINLFGVDAENEYYNGWGVTDNYDTDYPLCLKYGEDFTINKDRYEILLHPNTKQYWVYDSLRDVYIVPPTEVLDKVKNVWGTNEAEDIIYKELCKEPDWLNDANYFYDNLD